MRHRGRRVFRAYRPYTRRLPGWLLSGLALAIIFTVTRTRHLFHPARRDTTVAEVIDGDTIRLSDGRVIRYLGIDTPERGQPYYETAKEFNESLVKGKRVRLEFDVERRDRYGRWLAYVFVKDEKGREIFVNAELIRAGMALVYTRPPNVRYADLFVQLQREAREETRGLWNAYRPSPRPVVGNRRTRTFHRPDCPSVQDIHPNNITPFPDAMTALDIGFHPCRRCRP